jgi:hypothetical protein
VDNLSLSLSLDLSLRVYVQTRARERQRQSGETITQGRLLASVTLGLLGSPAGRAGLRRARLAGFARAASPLSRLRRMIVRPSVRSRVFPLYAQARGARTDERTNGRSRAVPGGRPSTTVTFGHGLGGCERECERRVCDLYAQARGPFTFAFTITFRHWPGVWPASSRAAPGRRGPRLLLGHSGPPSRRAQSARILAFSSSGVCARMFSSSGASLWWAPQPDPSSCQR